MLAKMENVPKLFCCYFEISVFKILRVGCTKKSFFFPLLEYSKIPLLRPPFGLPKSDLISEVVLVSNIDHKKNTIWDRS